ncbi:aminotransferase class V-fold PLP-dependent enzyme [Candidatus Amarolinea dominans]|uniref:aminotransferase class V-fold PLP-dependent enzyme n=1 Tax=Candidatus Amarolinea dominans TaxID=3140696 RepID=UPI001D75DCDA|nr:aminotransferase class V-fold PLP-dependent enzyme [Anaerolineae bacterium]MBK7201831.1 aminotransferase class V-fold PLP-dependent enzyme [Anaerolineae bacterium]MBK9095659.1 aminotransferase class V-fold PLP-dependent enzyme [Anaerolineae bacterium]
MLTLDQIRQELPAVQRAVYLNTGSNGPLPRAAAVAMAEAAARELNEGRIVPTAWQVFSETKIRLREDFAALLHAPPTSVALTHSTTEGVNLALWGLNWQAGDEVITTTLEHPGVTVPLTLLRQRAGVTVRFAEVGLGQAERVLDALSRAFTRRTRLVALSHVSYSSGAVFPLAEIVELAHRHGAWVLVDATQSLGAIPVDVTALGVDFYACSGQKWLCGPEGVGALYVHPDRFDDLLPAFGGYSTFLAQNHRGWIVPQPGAARYESIAFYPPTIWGMAAGLKWLRDEVGFDAIFSSIAANARTLRDALAPLPGVTLLTPAQQQAGLVNFDLEGWSPQALAGLVEAVEQAGYTIRTVPHPPFGLRASTGFFNTNAELLGLAAEIRAWLARGPAAVKAPPMAVGLPAQYVKPG